MLATLSVPTAASLGRRATRVLPPLVLAALASAVVLPAFAHALEVWADNAEFSYGFLVPPVAAGLAWWRRDALARSLGPGAGAGLAIVGCSLALAVAGQRTGIHALTGLAVSPLLFGIVVCLWGWRAGRTLAFPIAFLAFGLVLYRGLLSSVGFGLQDLTAHGAEMVAHAVGLTVARDGLLLQSDRFAFVVAEQCSGLSSLLSLLALAAVWSYLGRGSLLARGTIWLSVLPLVLVANTLRVVLVLLVAAWFGQDAALGLFHGASSLLLFGLALGGLVLMSRMLGCSPSRRLATSS